MDQEVQLLNAMAQLTEAHIAVVHAVQRRPDVTKVKHRAFSRVEGPVVEGMQTVGTGDGFRFEWYVEVDFQDDAFIEFATELSWHPRSWTFEPYVTAIVGGEEKVLMAREVTEVATVTEIMELLRGGSATLGERVTSFLAQIGK